jgi:peptidyl-prolyl cis-trans isomerase A (cyclophilin A)
MNRNSTGTLGFTLLILWMLLGGCGPNTKKPEGSKPQVVKGSYKSNIKGMVEIQTTDHYTRPIKKGFGFFVGKETVVTNLDLIQGAYRAKIAAPGTTQYFEVEGYTQYSLHLNLVLLKVTRRNDSFLKFFEVPATCDSLYTLKRPQRDLFVSRSAVLNHQTQDSSSWYQLRSELEPGKPAFFSDHGVAGIIQQQKITKDSAITTVLDSRWISQLMEKQQPSKPIINLSSKTNKVYISHKNVAGFKINTNMGSVVIKLFDETPVYRDNFIKLVSDHFYDSLLVHRVIRNFLIQTGASDTRTAGRDDVVGWQGPGYSLPMHVVPGIFHRRGALAASKLPSERNPRNFSDGSQFYIVCGRVFTTKELDDLEKEKKMKFTADQRSVYTTQGGAPYLDGDYTVFGEVVSGMEVVDKIASLEVYNIDRPEVDVRIRNIEILKR